MSLKTERKKKKTFLPTEKKNKQENQYKTKLKAKQKTEVISEQRNLILP